MKRFAFSLLTTAFLVVLVRAKPQETAVREGQWEIETTFEMSGVPMTPPPRTVARCLTAADAKDLREIIRQSQAPENECAIDGYEVAANHASWTMTCSGKYRGAGSGEITFGGDRYDGSFVLKIQDSRGAGHAVTYRMQGRRIGACAR